jgi:hypothetical protein
VLAALVRGLEIALNTARTIARHRASGATIDCPAGHSNGLVGRWKCACGFDLVGHAFAACPSCGEEAGWFPCRACGLGVQDPLQR